MQLNSKVFNYLLITNYMDLIIEELAECHFSDDSLYKREKNKLLCKRLQKIHDSVSPNRFIISHSDTSAIVFQDPLTGLSVHYPKYEDFYIHAFELRGYNLMTDKQIGVYFGESFFLNSDNSIINDEEILVNNYLEKLSELPGFITTDESLTEEYSNLVGYEIKRGQTLREVLNQKYYSLEQIISGESSELKADIRQHLDLYRI